MKRQREISKWWGEELKVGEIGGEDLSRGLTLSDMTHTLASMHTHTHSHTPPPPPLILIGDVRLV